MPRRPPRLTPPRPSGGTRYPTTHRNRAVLLTTTIGHCQNPNGCPHPDSATTTNPLTLDHPQPRSRGGTHDQPQPLVLCRRCNTTKNNNTNRNPNQP